MYFDSNGLFFEILSSIPSRDRLTHSLPVPFCTGHARSLVDPLFLFLIPLASLNPTSATGKISVRSLQPTIIFEPWTRHHRGWNLSSHIYLYFYFIFYACEDFLYLKASLTGSKLTLIVRKKRAISTVYIHFSGEPCVPSKILIEIVYRRRGEQS